MATQSGLANLKVVGPIDIPNNQNTVIYTMERAGLVFVGLTSFVHQDINRFTGYICWQAKADGEPTFPSRLHVLFGATGDTGGTKDPTLYNANFVPAGADIRQHFLRSGSNYVRVYLYILEFDDSVIGPTPE